MPYLGQNGCRIYYEMEGDTDRPTLLLSNSLGTTLAMWEPQMKELRKSFSVLRYDGRGHGRSSISGEPLTLSQLGQDVLALLDHLALGRVHLCGLSMGGMVGQWVAIHAPDRLHKLVLCNTAARIGTDASWNQRIDAVESDGIHAVVSTVLDRWFTPQFCAADPDRIAWTRAMLEGNDRAGYIANCAAIRAADLRAEVHRIATPALIVYGRYDRVTTPDDAQFLAGTVPATQSLELEAAHLSNVEAAAAFTAGILQFLTQGDSHG